MATEYVAGYDNNTNKYVVLGDTRPSPRDIVFSMFHSKEYKLRDLAKYLGVKESIVFKIMYNRNTEELDKLMDRVTEVESGVWVFDLTNPVEVSPVLPDEVKPVAISAIGINNLITITFEDVNYIDPTKIPPINSFVLLSNEKIVGIARVQMVKNSNTVKLLTSTPIVYGDVLQLSYTTPNTGTNKLQDTAKNVIDSFEITVTNTTIDPNATTDTSDTTTENTTTNTNTTTIPPSTETPPAPDTNTTPPTETPNT